MEDFLVIKFQNKEYRKMVERSVTFFSVGNGNCCLVQIGEQSLVFDLKGTDDKSSFELLKPMLKQKNGKYLIDVLCISHGDKDHCGGFNEFKKLNERANREEIVIGSIWHPNYDRTKVSDEEKLPEDYMVLHNEILRRKKSKEQTFGNIEVPLTAWDDEKIAFEGLKLPENLSLYVISPYLKDDEKDFDVNDMSLAINLQISGLSILFPGDSGSKIWQERIIRYTLSNDEKKDKAKADILLAPHHGSYTFFGENRDEVRTANEPSNYKALNYIKPQFLIISAKSKFPLNGDESGDLPPHYAAWKWYHKWFQEHRQIPKEKKHPSKFKYTSDGHIRLEYDGSGWKWNDEWSPPDGEDNENGKNKSVIKRFIYRGGETKRGGNQYAKPTK
jgi:beta-lactamase superfamily II metal-dependent hydrolase